MRKGTKKYIPFLIIIALIFLCSCNEQQDMHVSEQASKTVEEKSNEELVAEYGKPLISAYTQGQHAKEIANLNAVKSTVEAYHALHDRYPQNLEEIKDMIGAKIDLSRYDYDPDSGAVSLKE